MSLNDVDEHTEDEAEQLPSDAEDHYSEWSLNNEILISGAAVSENGSIPLNVLEFKDTFGYDCQKNFNLCLIVPNVLVYACGNIIVFFEISTLQILHTRRSARGRGIGCITKNPNPDYNYLTIAENGKKPPIIIYNYPKMEVVSFLRNGTTYSYSKVNYSPNGKLLASQGGDPDYMITIWNWEDATIILRSKSFQNDVLNIMFSPFVPGQLTTSGLSHIKFWKMCETFTGLKLKGDLGRFGKTEICDILGIFPMPDEKVLSGTEWGNILVWDAGLIKFEVCRKGRKKCHTGPISQIYMNEGEVMTLSLDGYVRIWFWETVDLADPPEDDRVVEIEPVYEYLIGEKNCVSKLKWMVKMIPDNDKNYFWYSQDANGGIWLCDISPENKPLPPQRLFRCHAGEIIAVGASSVSPHFATFGKDGRLHIYNYLKKKLLYFKQFSAKGGDMIWLPKSVDSSGAVIVMGFDDGVIRMVCVDVYEPIKGNDNVFLIQVVKSHSKPITKLSINDRNTVLVSGSEDNTIFIHQLFKQLPYISLIPIGLLQVPSPVTCLFWKPYMFATVLIGCLFGEILEAELPERQRSYTEISYALNHIKPNKIVFKSTKSQIRRNLKILEIENRKARKRAKKIVSLERLRIENPGVAIDEETFLQDSESEEDLEPLYIPKIPNRVLWMHYTQENTIWVSMSGYDAGYIYEYAFGNEEPSVSFMIPNADNIEIPTIYNFNEYYIFGMSNGVLRITQRKPDFRDLSDYWTLSMHDNFTGAITGICSSFDDQYLFTVGTDGNIFSYKWANILPSQTAQKLHRIEIPKKINDIEDASYLSLEEQKQKDEYDRQMAIANEKKNKVFDILSHHKMQFRDILKRNRSIAPSQQITQDELELDARITEDLLNSLDEQLKLTQRKLAFDVEKMKLAAKKLKKYFLEPLADYPIEVIGILTKEAVKSIRIVKLSEEYYFICRDLEERIKLEQERRIVIKLLDDVHERDDDVKLKKIESFLQGLTASTIQFRLQTRMKRLLNRYRTRKAMEEAKKEEWEYVNSLKPDQHKNHPDDELALTDAINAIGDYKLKIDPMYMPSEEEKDTTFKKFEELLRIREEIFNKQQEYNKTIYDLRDEKVVLLNYIKTNNDRLNKIHLVIPLKKRKFITNVTNIQFDETREFPEKAFNIGVSSTTNKTVGTLINRFSMCKPTIIENLKPDISALQMEVLGLRQQRNSMAVGILTILDTANIEHWSNTDLDTIKSLSFEERDSNSLTMEIRQMNLANKLHEQDQIIFDINKKVSKFDQRILSLQETRFHVDYDSQFLEIYLLTLNQELWILKDFEKLENILVERVDLKLIKRNEIQSDIITKKNNIEMHHKNIEKMNEQEKVIHQQFLATCMDNKFSDFFRRIFKKKFKAPKTINPDDEFDTSSSSSDSSSSEEEEDAASIDSAEIGPIRLDDNECPPGCDRKLYDLTFILRSQRHVLEQNSKDEQKSIDLLRKEIEFLNKNKKIVEGELDIHKDELRDFQREKQKKLNQVDTLVILKMNQMQYFTNIYDFKDIDNTLLFNNQNVTKLYTRVGQLALETLEAKRKHRINVVHLSRMKTDCKFMENEIIDLKEKIHDTMIKKFGMEVSLDEVQEQILRRYVYDIKANTDNIKTEFEERTEEYKKIYAERQEEYKKVIQLGTEKLNILTVLYEELNYLKQALLFQEKLNQQKQTLHADYNPDLTKLREIARQQKDQIMMLQREIKALSLKSKPISSLNVQDFRLSCLKDPASGFGERVYEESITATVNESMALSSPNSPDYNTINNITKIVTKFLTKNLSTKLDFKEINKKSYEISKYFGKVAMNYTSDNDENVLSCVVDHFKSIMSKELMSEISPKEIATLFEAVVKNFRQKESDLDPHEVIKSITENVQEFLNEKKNKSINVIQELLFEILKLMLLTLHVGEISNVENIEYLTSLISNMPNINPNSIDVKALIDSLTEHANENLIDDVDMLFLRHLIESIQTSLSGKIHDE